MPKPCRIAICLALGALLCLQPTHAQSTSPQLRTLAYGGENHDYYIDLSADFDPATTYWPLVVDHGGGGKAAGIHTAPSPGERHKTRWQGHNQDQASCFADIVVIFQTKALSTSFPRGSFHAMSPVTTVLLGGPYCAINGESG